MLEEERESLSIKEMSRLLAEFIDKRKKMMAAKRAEEKRNKPPTQAQQRTYMSNYLKSMGGYTLKQLKNYSFKEIKMLFDNTIESIKSFVPMESEGQAGEGSLKEGESLKRSAEEELGQKQKEDMKIVFEPDGDDEVWKNHHSQELIEWKLYDSYRVHSLMLGEVLTQSIKCLEESSVYRRLNSRNLKIKRKITSLGEDCWRIIDQSVGGKLRDKKAKESWTLLEDLALYDNESWNDPQDFTKPVKAISLPQDVSSSSDHHARLSKFEADFKQQQGGMTNKIDTFLKAINDRMMGSVPSDMVKNTKLNVNSTSSVLSGHSYPTKDPQCSSHIENSINAIKSCSKLNHHLNKEDEPTKTGIIKLYIKDNDHDMIVKVKEESEESKEN
uniref:MAK10-like protein n=1 Tax=Tanacetum cinerariifolium TaxID=118510 RepID=A0A6L2JUJ3_TANCI|nr:MAK10-like protein [Tanacetum cinerariifolium]